MTEFCLVGGDFSASPVVEAALQHLNLPVVEQKRLETALAKAVGHAQACEAYSLYIRLLVSKQLLADEIARQQTEITERRTVISAPRRSWGFFLVHTQTSEQADPQSGPGYQIELFIYREDDRSEPDVGE